MTTLPHSPPQTQAGVCPFGELTAALAHPLTRAAIRLEWLGQDGERDALNAEAFGNPFGVPLQRLRASALLLAAEECRDGLRCGFPPEGDGYAQAVRMLRELADTQDDLAAQEALPRCLPARPSEAAIVPLFPDGETRALLAAGHRCDAALLRYAADVLGRETPPIADALAA